MGPLTDVVVQFAVLHSIGLPVTFCCLLFIDAYIRYTIVFIVIALVQIPPSLFTRRVGGPVCQQGTRDSRSEC
jgi:hypothetical protein